MNIGEASKAMPFKKQNNLSALYREKENTVSVEEKNKNEVIYLASVAVLRRLYQKGIDVKILERLNRKNAEATGCIPTDFINY